MSSAKSRSPKRGMANSTRTSESLSRKSSSRRVDQVLNGTTTAPIAAAAKKTSSHSMRLSQSKPIAIAAPDPEPAQALRHDPSSARRAPHRRRSPSSVIATARSGAAAACSQSSSNIVRLRGACICYLGGRPETLAETIAIPVTCVMWLDAWSAAVCVRQETPSDASREGSCPPRRADHDRQSAKAQRPVARRDGRPGGGLGDGSGLRRTAAAS